MIFTVRDGFFTFWAILAHSAPRELKRRAARRQSGSVAKVDNMQMNSSWKCRHASEIYASHNNQGMTKATFLQLAEYLFMKKGSLWLIIEANCCLEARAKKKTTFKTKPMANCLA